jgi:hypothetical protein
MNLEEFKKNLEKKISRNELKVDKDTSDLEKEKLDRKEFIMHFKKFYRTRATEAFETVKSTLSERFEIDYDRGAASSFYDDQIIEGVLKLKPKFESKVSEVFVICIGESYNKKVSLSSRIKLKANQPTVTGPSGMEGSLEVAKETDFVESVASMLHQITF